MLDSIFEGFSIWVRSPMQVSDVRDVLLPIIGSEWEIKAFGVRTNGLFQSFDLTSSSRQLSVSAAWELSYKLRELNDVIYAEPLFEAAVSGRPDWNQDISFEIITTEQLELAIDRGADLCGSSPDFPHLHESDESEWSLDLMKVPSAWQRFFPDGSKQPGEGVVIGHPDTGFQPNPEILPNLLIDRGFDFLDCDRDATDPLENKPPGVLIPNPGHGSGTSSIIISPRGDQTPTNPNEKFVSGVAPGAKLIPLRITKSVVLFGMMKLAQSIDYAVENEAHIISLSLGGLPSLRLRQSIINAQAKGVIVTAAAGNCVRFVVWPAAYDEVIGVAACNAKGEIWIGSSRGKAVDVTAPGESVWHATAKRNEQTGEVFFGVNRGNGTSFAVTAVAGVAALWLSYHGRDKLIQKYGLSNLSAIFKQVLGFSCDPISVTESEVGQFGTGIINAEKVLSAPLPEQVEDLVSLPELLEENSTNEENIKAFNGLFDRVLPKKQKDKETNEGFSGLLPHQELVKLLDVKDGNSHKFMNEFGQELLFHFATNPDLYKKFSAKIVYDGHNMFQESRLISGAENKKQIEKFKIIFKLKDLSQKLKANLQV
jgi:serine protease